jgi:Calx-beta domain
VNSERSGGESGMDFDMKVRARRPEPSEELVERIVRRQTPRANVVGPARLTAAVVAVAALGGALSVAGAFGYAGSAVRQDLVQAKEIVLAGSQAVAGTPADDQYKPGKGCGDKNHLHDRRFECKITINDVSVKEGSSGFRSAVFTVSLDSSAIDQVTVDFATSDGTATAPGDDDAGAGTLTFAVGESTKTVAVVLHGDADVEPNETYWVTLSNPSANALLTDGQGTGTIRNDD